MLLVGGFTHLEKYEFVNGKDDIPYMMETNHVWNHQPVLNNTWLLMIKSWFHDYRIMIEQVSKHQQLIIGQSKISQIPYGFTHPKAYSSLGTCFFLTQIWNPKVRYAITGQTWLITTGCGYGYSWKMGDIPEFAFAKTTCEIGFGQNLDQKNFRFTGKLTFCYGKSPFLMGQLTINGHFQ